MCIVAGQADGLSGLIDGGHGIAESDARREIERNRYGWEKSLMRYGKRRGGWREVREGVERDLLARRRAHVNQVEKLRILPPSRRGLHDDVILIQRGPLPRPFPDEDGDELPCPEPFTRG